MLVKAFHGTNFVFKNFDTSKLGISCDNPTTSFGFFFTDNKDDAYSWAERAACRRRAPNNASIIEAEFELKNPIGITYEDFIYYLQFARKSTIVKQKAKWVSLGYDGIIIFRDGNQWYCPFDEKAINIVSQVKMKEKNTEQYSQISP